MSVFGSLFGGEDEVYDLASANKKIEALVQERGKLESRAAELEVAIGETKREYVKAEAEGEAAREEAQIALQVAAKKMEVVNKREVEIQMLKRRLAAVSGVYGLSSVVEKLAANINKARESTFPSPLVISGPTGVGKATLITKLFEEFEHLFGFPTSYTSRAMQHGETQGIDFFFTSRHEMENAMKQGHFLEISEVDGDLYGTTVDSVVRLMESGRICVLRIDLEGVQQLKSSAITPICVWVSPPSVSELRRRLVVRGVPDNEELRERLEMAEQEMLKAEGEAQDLFNHFLVNDSIEKAYASLRSILLQYPTVASEVRKRQNQVDKQRIGSCSSATATPKQGSFRAELQGNVRSEAQGSFKAGVAHSAQAVGTPEAAHGVGTQAPSSARQQDRSFQDGFDEDDEDDEDEDEESYEDEDD